MGIFARLGLVGQECATYLVRSGRALVDEVKLIQPQQCLQVIVPAGGLFSIRRRAAELKVLR